MWPVVNISPKQNHSMPKTRKKENIKDINWKFYMIKIKAEEIMRYCSISIINTINTININHNWIVWNRQ